MHFMKQEGQKMKTLSSREIMDMLREFGVSKKKDRYLYFLMYKSYFSLNYCRTLTLVKGLKKFVDNRLKKFDKLNICYSYNSED